MDKLRQIVEEAVSGRLSQHLTQLQQEIVEQVTREIQPLLDELAHQQPGESRGTPATETLNAAIASIQDSSVQADILKALLEGVSHFVARAALFVVRGTTLAGWQSRGFGDADMRGINIDGAQGLAAKAIHDRAGVSAAAVEFDSGFNQKHGNPSDGNATVFPLVVRDKVAAVLYCDAGATSESHADYAAVEVLTRYSSLWLEHIASRKLPASVAADAAITAPPPVASSAETITQAAAAAPAPAASAEPQPSLDGVPAEDQELHRKAKRFAKLLVDEIKLYNQAKVAEGRQNREIYKLLREDIEKSRATYEKRYSGTPVASASYFNEEVVRILADNDRALLGSDFPG